MNTKINPVSRAPDLDPISEYIYLSMKPTYVEDILNPFKKVRDPNKLSKQLRQQRQERTSSVNQQVAQETKMTGKKPQRAYIDLDSGELYTRHKIRQGGAKKKPTPIFEIDTGHNDFKIRFGRSYGLGGDTDSQGRSSNVWHGLAENSFKISVETGNLPKKLWDEKRYGEWIDVMAPAFDKIGGEGAKYPLHTDVGKLMNAHIKGAPKELKTKAIAQAMAGAIAASAADGVFWKSRNVTKYITLKPRNTREVEAGGRVQAIMPFRGGNFVTYIAEAWKAGHDVGRFEVNSHPSIEDLFHSVTGTGGGSGGASFFDKIGAPLEARLSETIFEDMGQSVVDLARNALAFKVKQSRRTPLPIIASRSEIESSSGVIPSIEHDALGEIFSSPQRMSRMVGAIKFGMKNKPNNKNLFDLYVHYGLRESDRKKSFMDPYKYDENKVHELVNRHVILKSEMDPEIDLQVKGGGSSLLEGLKDADRVLRFMKILKETNDGLEGGMWKISGDPSKVLTENILPFVKTIMKRSSPKGIYLKELMRRRIQDVDSISKPSAPLTTDFPARKELISLRRQKRNLTKSRERLVDLARMDTKEPEQPVKIEHVEVERSAIPLLFIAKEFRDQHDLYSRKKATIERLIGKLEDDNEFVKMQVSSAMKEVSQKNLAMLENAVRIAKQKKGSDLSSEEMMLIRQVHMDKINKQRDRFEKSFEARLRLPDRRNGIRLLKEKQKQRQAELVYVMRNYNKTGNDIGRKWINMDAVNRVAKREGKKIRRAIEQIHHERGTIPDGKSLTPLQVAVVAYHINKGTLHPSDIVRWTTESERKAHASEAKAYEIAMGLYEMNKHRNLATKNAPSRITFIDNQLEEVEKRISELEAEAGKPRPDDHPVFGPPEDPAIVSARESIAEESVIDDLESTIKYLNMNIQRLGSLKGDGNEVNNSRLAVIGEIEKATDTLVEFGSYFLKKGENKQAMRALEKASFGDDIVEKSGIKLKGTVTPEEYKEAERVFEHLNRGGTRQMPVKGDDYEDATVKEYDASDFETRYYDPNAGRSFSSNQMEVVKGLYSEAEVRRLTRDAYLQGKLNRPTLTIPKVRRANPVEQVEPMPDDPPPSFRPSTVNVSELDDKNRRILERRERIQAEREKRWESHS